MKRLVGGAAALLLTFVWTIFQPSSANAASTLFNRPLNLYNVATHKCADIPGLDRGRKDGPVEEFTCDYTRRDNQRFILERHGSYKGHPLVLIKNKTDGLCLDLPDFGKVPATTTVTEYTCRWKHDNQLYYLKPAAPGTHLLVNRASGLCLDVAGGRTGGDAVPLTVFGCDSRDDHLWALIDSSKKTVADAYAQAWVRGFANADSWAAERSFSASRASAKGMIVARLFIPNKVALWGFLKGDDRGYSSEPWASSRAVYTWDPQSARASLVVEPSRDVHNSLLPAYDLVRKRTEDRVLEEADTAHLFNYFNDQSHTYRDGTKVAQLSMSLSNSLIGDHNLVASIDGTLLVYAHPDGRFGVDWWGNGYPQIEVYYYPRHGNAKLLMRRDINPYAKTGTRAAGDPSGATALFDFNSFALCESGDRKTECTETSGWASAQPDWTTRW